MEKIKERLIKLAIELTKEKKGSILVIEDKKVNYEQLLPTDLKPFSIFDEKENRRLKLLASHDGACIINTDGYLIAYAVQIKDTKTFDGFGTRHSASFTASDGNTVIMTSEEDAKVRIFNNKKLIMEIDGNQKDIEKQTSLIGSIFESIGVGTVGVTGMAFLAPIIGITIASGITVFATISGATYVIKNWNKLTKFLFQEKR